MGIFSRVRRQSAAPSIAAEASPPPAEELAAAEPMPAELDPLPPPPEPAVATLGATANRGGTAGLVTLRDSLQQLYGIRPSRDAFAEEAIKLIARATNTKAAALLTY